MYIGSNTIAEPQAGALDFDTVRDWIDSRLDGLDPNRINTLYWHDSLHNYNPPSAVEERIQRWEDEFSIF